MDLFSLNTPFLLEEGKWLLDVTKLEVSTSFFKYLSTILYFHLTHRNIGKILKL